MADTSLFSPHNTLQKDIIKNKKRNVYIDADFVDQTTGAIMWHRRFNIISDNPCTFRQKMSDITDSLIRSSEVGNYSLLLSVRRPNLNDPNFPF